MSNKECLSPLERTIRQKIRATKSKAQKPGYLKELVLKEYETIEEALKSGCEFDDIASSISETIIKISAATLKKYHLANRKARQGSVISKVDKEEEKDNPVFPSQLKETKNKDAVPVVQNQTQSEVITTNHNHQERREEQKTTLAERLKQSTSSVDIFSDEDIASEFNTY